MTKDIYIIKNDINDKVYIGQAKDSKERFQSHCKPSVATLNNELIGKAIQKHGREHFWYEILEHQVEDYNEKEILIGKLDSTCVSEIIQLLKTTYRSFESIGAQYGVEARTISRINRGLLHRREIEYPIRLGRVGTSVKLTYEQVTEIINDLINTNLSLRAIANAHNCEYKDVLGIKNGTTKLYRRRGLTYPLRPNN